MTNPQTCLCFLIGGRHRTPTECGLRYIAKSPPPEYGGFDAETVRLAKAALRLIARLRCQVAQKTN